MAISGVLLGALLISLAYAWGPEKHWFIALFQYLPYPVYLLPTLAVVAGSVLLGWPWRIAALVALGLTLFPVMGLNWSSGDEGEGSLRVMSYNAKVYKATHQPQGLEKLAWEIAQHDPDILLMQDAPNLEMRRDSDPAVAHMFQGREVFMAGQYVVASRYPLHDCRVDWLPSQGQPLGYVHCLVNVRGATLELFNVHFLTPREGLNATRHEKLQGVGEWEANAAQRLEQAEALARVVQAARHPVIVGGDLNAPEPSLVVRALLNTGLRDSFSAAGKGFGHTYGHALRVGFSFLRIDHLLVDPLMGVASSTVGGGEASEHRPVIADLLLHRS